MTLIAALVTVFAIIYIATSRKTIYKEKRDKTEADKEKVKEMLARTQSDLININKEIAHWQDWLKQHSN